MAARKKAAKKKAAKKKTAKKKTARRRRRPAARTEPNRKTTFYRADDSSGDSCGPKHKGRYAAGVREAVGACKRLIDDQVKRGRHGGYDCSGSIGDQAQRMMRMFTDTLSEMSSMWFDYVGSIWCSDAWMPKRDSTCESEACPTPDIQVRASRKVLPCLELRPSYRPCALTFRPLEDKKGNPCKIDVDYSEGSNGALVQIDVPSGVPADRYHCLVLDEETGDIRGTLTVEVCET